MSRNVFPEVIRSAIHRQMIEVHTMLPGRIESYEVGSQRASVKPLVNPRLRDGRELDLPVIVNVRVLWPESGGASLTFPIREGDGCMLVFSEASLDRWLDEGGNVLADDERRHSLQDAVAVMGFEAFTAGTQAENNDDVLLTFDGSQVRLKPGGNVEIESISTVLVDSPDVVVECDTATVNASTSADVTAPQITLTGDVTINGDVQINGLTQTTQDVIAGSVSLLTHIHTGVVSGGGTSGPPA